MSTDSVIDLDYHCFELIHAFYEMLYHSFCNEGRVPVHSQPVVFFYQIYTYVFMYSTSGVQIKMFATTFTVECGLK